MLAIRCFSVLLLVLLAGGPAWAQLAGIPPGAYRTAAAYRLRRPQPAGTDAFYPDKRGQLVVEVPRGTKSVKLRVAPDSVWGYVSGKGRTFRLHRGEEYRLEFADTLCVYSSDLVAASGAVAGSSAVTSARAVGATRYFFSRGLTGLVFPLTVRYLREAYQASNPAFAAALGQLRFDQSLADVNRETGLYRVTTLYREAAGR